MTSTRALAAPLALCIAAGGVFAPAPLAPLANAQTTQVSTLTARQGGVFYTSKDRKQASTCTISYNNAAQRFSYTAGHCGDAGDPVYLRDAANRIMLAGTYYPSQRYGGNLTNDWGVIRWNPGIQIGPNDVSGNTVIHPSQLRKGDTVCVRGATSHGTTGTARSCAPYLGNINNTFFFDYAGTRPGDSGGVVFAPGRGYLGALSGVTELSRQGVKRATLERAAFPADGNPVSNDAMLRWANTNLPVDVERVNPVRPLQPTVPLVDDSVAASSPQGIAAIIAAVIGLLAVAAPLVQNVASFLRF